MAKSQSPDEIQHTVNVNAKQGLNEISKLQIEYGELTKHIDKLGVKLQKQQILLSKATPNGEREKKAKKAIEELNKQLDANILKQDKAQKRLTEITGATDLANISKSQLKRQLGYLNDQYNRLLPTQQDYIESQKRLEKQAKAVNDELEKRGTLLQKQGSFMQNLKASLPAAMVGGVAGALVDKIADGIGSVLSGIGQKIKAMGEKSDSIADLQLAFQSTAEEAKAINKELAEIDTRTTPKKLREIATAGGLLNVPREEIKGFVDETNKAVVVMEKDFPGGVEEVTVRLGKLKALYKETKDMKWAEAIRRDASAIKTLADNGTATASFLTDFATRMGQLPMVLRPSLSQVLGLGAAMEEAGIDSSMAANNISKALMVSANNADKVGKFFGKTKKEIQDLINTNPNEFLLELSTRLSKLKGTDLTKTLDSLKLADIQVVEVLGAIGLKLQDVRKFQDQASDSFLKGTQITESYNVKNETFGASLERLSNNYNKWWGDSRLSQMFTRIAQDITKGLAYLFQAEEDLTTKFNEQTESVNNLNKNIIPLLDKYDKLSKDKSAESQAELRRVMSQIITIMPDASYQVDSYGRALSINTTKTREFVEQQKAMLQVLNKEVLDKTYKENVDLQKKRNELVKEFRRVNDLPRNGQGKPYEKVMTGVSADGSFTYKTMIYDLKTLQKEIDETNAKVRSTGLAWYGLRGELKTPTTATPPPPISPTGGGLDLGEDDEKAKKLKQLAEDRLNNEIKINQEIDQMQINLIEDETKRKNAQLQFDFSNEMQTNKKLVEEQKMSASAYSDWMVAKATDVDRQIKKNDAEALAKKEKAEMDSAREVAVIVLQTRLELAEASHNKEAILAAKIALRKGQFEIEIEKATANAKQAVYEKYLADVEKLTADHHKSESDKKAKEYELDLEFYTKRANDDAEKAKRNKLQAEKDQRKALGDFAKASEDAFFSLVSARLEKEERAIDRRYDRELEALERQKEQKLISDEDYTKRREVLEKERSKKIAEVQRKQAIYDKAQALVQVAINTALAVSKVLAQTGVLAPATIPLIIGAGAVQAASIVAKPLPEIPSFDKGGDTNIFDRRMPANDGKNGFISVLHPNEYVVPEHIRNTRYWANIEPIIEDMRLGKIRSFDVGGSHTPAPSFSAPTSTANAAPAQYVVQFPPEMLNWFVTVQSAVEKGINLSHQDKATFLEELKKTEQSHASSLITKKPNSF